VNHVTLSQEETALVLARTEAKLSVIPDCGGRCAACNITMQPKWTGICGYASGLPLGLCPKCASYVNTKQAVDSALKQGYETKAPPLVYNPQQGRAEVEDDA
jgi:hypothetical protein